MTADPHQPVLLVEQVRKGFGAGARPVLDGVDLSLDRGAVVALVGRSGSGKTTLLTLVAGLDAPDAGTVLVEGEPVGRRDLPWRRVAILPQALGLLDELTVAENVALPLRLLGRPTDDEVPALLERLGIDHVAHHLPDEVSLGEQQRTALARAVIARPSLLLADEPISHQNDAWARAMVALIGELAEAGTACLLATHNVEAVGAAHRMVELRDGRLHDVTAAGRR